MPPPAVEKSFCTTREAATLLGVSAGTVQLWVENGLLQAWKTAGGHRRVLRDSVESLLHKKPAAPVGTTVVSVSGQRRTRVMVVEDDPSLLRLYETQLARWPIPMELTLIDNAISGLLQMGRSGPDLLITDLHMPGMDGFAMLRVLNQSPEMAQTKMVVVSGLGVDEVNARGGVPNGVEVLAKPIPFAQLLSIAQGVARQVANPTGVATRL
jgi:excisionase family DNA binding protein